MELRYITKNSNGKQIYLLEIKKDKEWKPFRIPYFGTIEGARNGGYSGPTDSDIYLMPSKFDSLYDLKIAVQHYKKCNQLGNYEYRGYIFEPYFQMGYPSGRPFWSKLIYFNRNFSWINGKNRGYHTFSSIEECRKKVDAIEDNGKVLAINTL